MPLADDLSDRLAYPDIDLLCEKIKRKDFTSTDLKNYLKGKICLSPMEDKLKAVTDFKGKKYSTNPDERQRAIKKIKFSEMALRHLDEQGSSDAAPPLMPKN